MIVNMHRNGWEIIQQRAHGLLAMKLASHWKEDARPAPEKWIETLLAIAEHDDGQQDWNGRNHLTEAGAPVDFTMLPFTMVQLKRVTAMSRNKSRWIALLISMHMTYLYESRRGQGKELDTFLDEQQVNQKNWRSQLNITKKTADEVYALMQWCDRLSLILCRNELPEGERWLEITNGPDGKNYSIMQRGDETITIEPWPFDQDKITFKVEATYLNKLYFESDDELYNELTGGDINDKEWNFVH